MGQTETELTNEYLKKQFHGARPVEKPPVVDRKAFRGPVGRFAWARKEQTEADPVGILVQELVFAGNLFGHGPYLKVGKDRHHTNIYANLVGGTGAAGRKGMSLNEAKDPCQRSDGDKPLFKLNLRSGLSTTEGLLWAMRSPCDRPEKGKMRHDDGGVQTLCVTETEMAKVLKRAGKDGNTLSETLRQLFDEAELENLSRTTGVTVSDPHFSLIGHITPEDLRRNLTECDMADGFGNRFLWLWVQRQKPLPDGGQDLPKDETAFITALQLAVAHAGRTGEIKRDMQANRFWGEIYEKLTTRPNSLFGKMTSRGDAIVCRLSMIFAIMECSSFITCEHLDAALALWNYSVGTVRFVFGDSLGDRDADEILRTLKSVFPEGMGRTAISGLFGGHRNEEGITRALGVLLDAGLVRFETNENDRGRPPQVWYWVEQTNDVA
jgi:hypothetical protein